ncbi:Penicillin-binding protein activator LpoA [Pseudidiomarina piscicola]|uniref:Penicillin-binding protein activator LpoA n=1 Tax=Pseudidiomarina piscicola TaxID=2614830 RepID=A0A6S6WLM1_9GAMM|nr:Penicillin-binding protein activator LpoA [Pseudidiomarina piscicola]VZT40491.1 Penicillin-binding protein activator LpoA [Pseudomonas aeruginosa]
MKLVNLAIVPKKLTLCIVVCSLVACASPTPQSEQQTPTTEASGPSFSDATDTSAKSLEQLLAGLDDYDDERAQRQYLLNQVELLQQQSQWQTSALLLSELERVQLPPRERQRAALAKAQWLASEGLYQDAQELLEPVLSASSQLRTKQQVTLFTFARDLAKQLAQPQRAAQLQLQLMALAEQGDRASVTRSWDYLIGATQPDQLTARGAIAKSWLALLQAVHQQLNAADTSAIQGWQMRHSSHPAYELATTLDTQLKQATKQRHALVLLPLSGAYAEQGQAVLDGMVMALESTPEFTITVRDSASFEYANLAEELQRIQADTLIGPLLKDSLSKVDHSALAATNTQWFALNTVEQLSAEPDLWYALAPEMEIKQVAEALAQRGVRHPLILAADSNRGQQAIDTFSTYFRAQQPQGTIETGLYRTTEDMKTIVQEKLGVAASEARIWQVKITAGKILVDAEARSRADIDAIFLPSTIEQTRLLKPFIDVNIAPFMDPIPVFATSASHIRSDQLSENDLDNVRFTEIPWLLPDHPNYTRLTELLQLRKHWSYNHARLAAFGHDAMQLAHHNTAMELVPGYSLVGLTGELSRAADSIQRELHWARYSGHRVQPASLDN